jgi:hypothetical protein
MLEGHLCNFFCSGGEHADVAHWHDNSWTHAEIRAAWRSAGVTVTRIAPAAEAPPRGDGAGSHLVYWRAA